MRKDSESRDRQQREVRVRAAKARAEFDRIKVIYDEEYKQASVKLEALKKTVAEEAKGIDPELLEKYKAIKRHSTADHSDSRRPLRWLQHAAPGGGHE